jgi:transcriptional regulator with XRE-family HTH domain
MNIGQAVAKRVNDLLKEHNKTQYRLAKETLISHNTITSIVNAKNRTANLQSIFLICRAFGISIGEFFADPIFQSPDLDVD